MDFFTTEVLRAFNALTFNRKIWYVVFSKLITLQIFFFFLRIAINISWNTNVPEA